MMERFGRAALCGRLKSGLREVGSLSKGLLVMHGQGEVELDPSLFEDLSDATKSPFV